MKTINSVLFGYFKSATEATDDWYSWRKFDIEKIPCPINLPVGSSLEQNISLKNQLHKEFLAANDDKKIAIIRFYISVWGGIHKTSDENIRFYALNNIEDIIKKGRYGIASWSKALCIRDPNRYAIYDSRVAIALNSLLIKYEVTSPILFPLVPGQGSRNRMIRLCIQKHAAKRNWVEQNTSDFYCKYNRLISKAAKKLGVEHARVEMLLFSKAIELVQEAFPGKEFK